MVMQNSWEPLSSFLPVMTSVDQITSDEQLHLMCARTHTHRANIMYSRGLKIPLSFLLLLERLYLNPFFVMAPTAGCGVIL